MSTGNPTFGVPENKGSDNLSIEEIKSQLDKALMRQAELRGELRDAQDNGGSQQTYFAVADEQQIINKEIERLNNLLK